MYTAFALALVAASASAIQVNGPPQAGETLRVDLFADAPPRTFLIGAKDTVLFCPTDRFTSWEAGSTNLVSFYFDYQGEDNDGCLRYVLHDSNLPFFEFGYDGDIFPRHNIFTNVFKFYVFQDNW